MQDAVIQNSCSKYSLIDDSSILFTDKKIFTVTTPKYPQNDRLHITHIHQPRRKTSPQNAWAHN